MDFVAYVSCATASLPARKPSTRMQEAKEILTTRKKLTPAEES